VLAQPHIACICHCVMHRPCRWYLPSKSGVSTNTSSSSPCQAGAAGVLQQQLGQLQD
jgi:hypothetical protein